MAAFQAAAEAFRAYATRTLGTKDLLFGPNALGPNGRHLGPHAYGGAYSFDAAPATDPRRRLRGWALADGTVITTEQNFGKLLDEAGLWASPRPDQAQLCKAIAWSLGNAYDAPGPPDIRLDADGAGTITCFLTLQEAGGGGHLGPLQPAQVVIEVKKDHTASVHLRRS